MFGKLLKKHGLGVFMMSISLDAYRRQLADDSKIKVIRTYEAEKEALLAAASEQEKQLFEQEMLLASKNVKLDVVGNSYQEAATNYSKAVKELDEALDEMSKSKQDISDMFMNMYNNYVGFLDGLTPDKIVCFFNIIAYGLILSSFFTVISVMLSDVVLDRITFLYKYPKLLSILRFRNKINKKVGRLYLLIHVLFIIFMLCY